MALISAAHLHSVVLIDAHDKISVYNVQDSCLCSESVTYANVVMLKISKCTERREPFDGCLGSPKTGSF